MYKNQLQELAQRSCFNLPSYACIRAGPDHAPRFKASVNFNGEVFESPSYSSTLRQAEHAAAEVAINVLSSRGPSRSLTARVLDETGVYKNLLQETAHRAGLNLPVYTTVRSGPGHLPVFTCTVNLAGMNFTGVSAKTKKQAEKNAAIAAWSALKRIPNIGSSSQTNKDEEEDHVVVSRVLSSFKLRDDQSKQVRKWDHSRARRRVFVKGHGDNSFASSSTYNKYLQEMRPIDLLVESSTQNQKSFTSLLPPPPPRTTSRILPPLPTSFTDNLSSLHKSNRPLQDQVSVKSQAKLEEMSEEHQRDEEEWLGGETDIGKKPIELKGPANSYSSTDHGKSSIYRPFPLLNLGKLDNSMSDKSSQDGQTHIVRSRAFGPLTPSSMAASPTKPIHINRPIYSGGFHHPRRIAPAVQIRSVIPVCAAPPPMRPPPQSSQPSSSLQLHTSSTSSALGPSSSSPVPNQTELDQESSISSILDKLLL